VQRTFVIMSLLAVWAVGGCGSAGRQFIPAAVPVSSHETVLGSGVDALDPPSKGMTFAKPVSEALAVARANEVTGPYLSDWSRLQVEQGAYSNHSLTNDAGQPMQNEPVYAVRCGQSVCRPVGGVPTSAAQVVTTPGTCTATILLSASSGEVLFIVEHGNG